MLTLCDVTQFYSPVSGGVKRYLNEKIAYMRRARPNDRHVLIIPGERTEKLTDGLATTYTVASPLISRISRYRALLNRRRVAEILQHEQPDIIESGDPYQIAWKAIHTGRALGIPVVGFYHSHFPESYLRGVGRLLGAPGARLAVSLAQRYVKKLYNSFDRTLVASPALADVLRGWQVERVNTVELGVDLEFFRKLPIAKAQLRKELSVPIDAVLLLYIGRLAREKNTRTLFRAFEVLCKEQPGRFCLFINGDGLQRSEALALKERTGAVHWESYCTDPRRLAKIYNAADVFVHPGVQETFGLVTLESQACATPVVGIRGSYMDRIVFSNQECWAGENTPLALAEAIQKVCAQDLEVIGNEVSQRVRERYSWDATFDRLFAIYEEVIAEVKKMASVKK